MATLTIRKVPDRVRNGLRVRAAKNGRSLEAEAREILAVASTSTREAKLVDPDKAFAKLRASLRKANKGKMPTGVVDEFLRERRREWGEDE